MSYQGIESVVDDKKILAQKDHMDGLEKLVLTVVSVNRPLPSVGRVTGRIQPQDIAAWEVPNVAMRLEVAHPEGQRPVSRVYTVRSFDAETLTLEIDFVLHGDESPAMRWLNAARPGSELPLTGPRPHFLPRHLPGHVAVLLADETAIPALVPILAAWPADAPGMMIVETADPAAFAELTFPAGVEGRLILRASDRLPGRTGPLVDAALALDPGGKWTIWAAGEREDMRAIRQHFQRVIALPRESIRVEAYWRDGTSSTDIDRARLAHYTKLREAGKGLKDFDSEDLLL